MSTFAELHKELQLAKGRLTVLKQLVDYLEGNFLKSSPEIPPKELLLTDENIVVPQEVVDGVIESLLKEVASLENTIKTIMESTIQPKEN